MKRNCRSLPSRSRVRLGSVPATPHKSAEVHSPRPASARKPPAGAEIRPPGPISAVRLAHSRDRKPTQSSSGSRPVRRWRDSGRQYPYGQRCAAPLPLAGTPKPPPSNGKRNGAQWHGCGQRKRLQRKRPAGGSPLPAPRPRSAKSAAPAWSQRNGRSNGAKPAGKSEQRVASRNGNGAQEALAAGSKAGNSKQYSFTARPKQGKKKRG